MRGQSGAVLALVLADTHLRPDRARGLPDQVWSAARRADVVLHAGDVVTADLLDDLGRLAPVQAVLGNNDVALRGRLPDRLELELGGVAVGMVHDSGPSRGREARLRRWFPDSAVVVFGHSHLPLAQSGVDGQLLFNPGSCTERRRAPTRTYGELELDCGRVVAHRLVDVEEPATGR